MILQRQIARHTYLTLLILLLIPRNIIHLHSSDRWRKRERRQNTHPHGRIANRSSQSLRHCVLGIATGPSRRVVAQHTAAVPFLIDNHETIAREARIRAVSFQAISAAQATRIYADIESGNMNRMRP